MRLCNIIVDIGAEESVWPMRWIEEQPTRTVESEVERLVVADDQKVAHQGRTRVRCNRIGVDEGILISFNFEVTCVLRPLMVVLRVAEGGNKVPFERGRISNKANGTMIPPDPSARVVPTP